MAEENLQDHSIQNNAVNTHNAIHEVANTHAVAEHHNQSHNQMTQQDVYPKLFGENLGNHRDFSWLGQNICELPVIVYDSHEGLHVYSSSSAMVKDGKFTMKIHGEDHQLRFATKNDLKADHPIHWKPPIVKTSTIHETAKGMVGTPVTFDISISSLVLFQWFAMALLLIVFAIVGKRYRKNPKKAPHGIQNVVEAVSLFVRDEIVNPNCGTQRAAKALLPYFIGLFFFILAMNLFGLVPGGHTATGSIAVTGALAVVAYFVINITAMVESGVGTWFKHLLGGAPIWLAPIMIPIEIISMFVKPFALCIRLFANMTAGHVVLFSLVGLIFFFKLAMSLTAGIFVAPVAVAFSVFMYMLELLVAFLQAYIFTILTAVFVGLAIGEHSKEHKLADEH